MKRTAGAIAVIAALAMLAAGSAGDARERRAPSGAGYANPSALIAAEIAFDQSARDKGQWTAFRATAAPDAVMFVPQMVYAQQWLKGRADPARAIRRQPHQVWSSCDGSVVVTHGAWQDAGTAGYFTTIWRRQRRGDYKWVLYHNDPTPSPLAPPEMLAARVADCPDRSLRPNSARAGAPADKHQALAVLDPRARTGRADDGTLTWTVSVEASGARTVSVTMTQAGETAAILTDRVAASGS